jgi:hypothetical protein
MAHEIDPIAHARALKVFEDIKDHLMTWPELEAYALGFVSFVASVSPNRDVILQGIEDPDRTRKIAGQFLRLDFDRYWVCSPAASDITQSPLTPFQYKEEMKAWIEQIPMLPAERHLLVNALAEVRTFDHPSFNDFTDLLLSHPVTQFEIRRDLVAYVCSPGDLAILLNKALEQLTAKKQPKGRHKGKGRHLH